GVSPTCSKTRSNVHEEVGWASTTTLVVAVVTPPSPSSPRTEISNVPVAEYVRVIAHAPPPAVPSPQFTVHVTGSPPASDVVADRSTAVPTVVCVAGVGRTIVTA